MWDLKEFQIWNDLIFVRRGWRAGREGQARGLREGGGATGHRVRTSNSHARYKSVKTRPPTTPWTVRKAPTVFCLSSIIISIFSCSISRCLGLPVKLLTCDLGMLKKK